jgi:hypothetical protein
MTNIKRQMLNAQQLLLRLSSDNSLRQSLCRGGAPRNWFYNREANDLDIFVEVHQGFASVDYWETKVKTALGNLYQRFEFQGDNMYRLQRLGGAYRTDVHDPYTGGDHRILSVLEGMYEGEQKVQFVIYNTEDHVGTDLSKFFPTDFSKISFDMHGNINVSPEFLNCYRNKAITYDRWAMSDAYLKRLHSHYPTHALVPSDSPLHDRVRYS